MKYAVKIDKLNRIAKLARCSRGTVGRCAPRATGPNNNSNNKLVIWNI